MGTILKLLGNLIGIGKDALQNKAKLKRLKQEQEFKVLEAHTKANVDRILSNTNSDNQIDLITAQQKNNTFKDEVITYLFLIPLFIATITPFIIAFKENSFINLSEDISLSYENLNQLPTWYRYTALLSSIVDFLILTI